MNKSFLAASAKTSLRTSSKTSLGNSGPKNLQRRNRNELIFHAIGFSAMISVIVILLVLLIYIIGRGLSSFRTTDIYLPFTSSIAEDEITLAIIRKQLLAVAVRQPENRTETKALFALLTSDPVNNASWDYDENRQVIGGWILASSLVDTWKKDGFDLTNPETDRPISDYQILQLDTSQARDQIRTRFAHNFFTNPDSRYPELAGILGAFIGSFYTMMVTFVLAFPTGVLAAIYLEEFARKNWVSRMIEININNLAAVPSIVFGLLGLTLFINGFALPRSAPVVGGLVLALMVFPVVIISARAALQAVPNSLREAALGLGASQMQTVMHHVIPKALPGILTGSIIGMARALGESAPLLMIGMVAFVSSLPENAFSPASVLPVQIYIWSDSPERGFIEKTSGGIIVLLLFLLLMNISSQLIRHRLQSRNNS